MTNAASRLLGLLRRKPKARWPRRVAVVAIVLFLLGALGVLLRNPLASLVASRVLAARGLRCDHVQVRVPLTLMPNRVDVGPMRCDSSLGAIDTIDFREPLTVQLHGFKPTAVRCGAIALNFRPAPHREVDLNTMGDIADLAGGTDLPVEMLFNSAELAHQNEFPLTATHATVTRARQPLADLDALRLVPTPTGMTLSGANAEIHQMSVLGHASLYMTASQDRVHMEVRFSPLLHVNITGEHMRARRPRVEFELEL